MIRSNPPGVLGEIGLKTKTRIEALKKQKPVSVLEETKISRKPRDLAQVMKEHRQPAVIAEVKLASPSQGDIAPGLLPVEVAGDYLAAGAAALSVLTEPEYFKGDIEYLRSIREAYPSAVLLMKDFVVDPYQLHLATWAGADAVLLIVALLDPKGLKALYEESRSLGLSVLVEVHNEEELKEALALGPELVGVNNRDLRNLSIDLATSETLIPRIPENIAKVAESGLEKAEDLERLVKIGCDGFLIGTSFMKTRSPHESMAYLKAKYKELVGDFSTD